MNDKDDTIGVEVPSPSVTPIRQSTDRTDKTNM